MEVQQQSRRVGKGLAVETLVKESREASVPLNAALEEKESSRQCRRQVQRPCGMSM